MFIRKVGMDTYNVFLTVSGHKTRLARLLQDRVAVSSSASSCYSYLQHLLASLLRLVFVKLLGFVLLSYHFLSQKLKWERRYLVGIVSAGPFEERVAWIRWHPLLK
jgi:hypothetical protein